MLPNGSSSNRTKINQRRRKGFAVMLSALMLVWIIPLVGLVIDVGVMYSIKARLSAACDAAALSAARSLSTGMALVDQEAAARNRAETFFKANFPVGAMETTGRQVNVTIQETEARVRRVRVEGSAAAPVYFMQALGASRTVVAAMGEASRRDVNVMMVIDRSGSLQAADACDDLEEAAMAFSGLFANGRDRMGFVTFAGDYRVDYPMTKNFKQSPSVNDELDKLFPGGCNGWTGSAQALYRGYEELAKVAEPGALNILVFFTDGWPNTITADWRVDTDPAAPGAVSRCWDWQRNVPQGNALWNPVNQRYRGFIAQSEKDPAHTGDGIRTHLAGPMPAPWPERVSIPQGYTGVAKPEAQDCFYRSTGSPVQDIAYYPDRDLYGNKTNTGYKPVQLISGGPYDGYLRPDDSLTRLNAAINAVDNAADRVRKKEFNPSVTVQIHTIGLGEVGESQHELLKRIANAPDSNAPDVNAPQGMYVFAPTPAQLAAAFQKVGGEILRLSK